MALHPDPVAKNGATREGRGRIHRQHPHLAAIRTGGGDQAVGKGGLAATRCPGDTDNLLDAGTGGEGELTHVASWIPAPLDQGEQSADRGLVSGLGGLEKVRRVTAPPRLGRWRIAR